ncbi:MAG: ABC transporter ATP-binding protein [Candidatus Limnocylindrales bacterium]
MSGSASPGPPAVETRDLVKRYGHTVALDRLTMSVPRGEVFGFLGPNGAGKTTAIKVLLGLTRTTSGGAWVLGRPAGDLAARRRIGYLPEMFRYQAWLTGREVLALHCRLSGLPRPQWDAEIRAALEAAGLADRAGDRVAGYSKGMQQRLGLAVALLGRPDVVFLDEPTSALDPLGRLEMRPILRALRDRGATVFLNSHLLSEVERVCDRVAILDHGRLAFMGPLAELLEERVVRVHVSGPDEALHAVMARFGSLTADAGWVEIRGCDPERIPDLVAALVEAGGRVHAVEPRQTSLEERFQALVGGATR